VDFAAAPDLSRPNLAPFALVRDENMGAVTEAGLRYHLLSDFRAEKR
jgi:hypothetical protein